MPHAIRIEGRCESGCDGCGVIVIVSEHKEESISKYSRPYVL